MAEEVTKLHYEELMNLSNIAKILGYDSFENYEDLAVYPKGYRILNKVPKVPSNIVDNLVKSFKSFQHILDAGIEDLDNVEGIGEVRARSIKQSLNRMQEQFVFDNIIN
jgi:diadenylate cyclase